MTSAHDTEEWRPVPDYENLYEVSNFGRVRKSKSNKNGPFKAGYVLKPKLTKFGHHYHCLYDGYGKQQTRLAHRLVALAFIGPPPAGCECCHADGNPTNNAVSNLRWDTRKNNIADAVKHGTHNKGSVNGMSKLVDADVLKIRGLRKQGMLLTDLSARFGVSVSIVSQISNRSRWKHLP